MEIENKIIRVEEDFIVAYKDSYINTVPLKGEGNKPSLLNFVSAIYPDILSVSSKNEWERGVLHRLDFPTKGLVLIARKQNFYDKMLEEQKRGRFVKRYVAKTEKSTYDEGFPPFNYDLKEGVCIKSKFRSYSKGAKAVRPLIEGQYLYKKEAPIYETYVDKIDGSVFYLMLRRGFRHQIRCHLAWSGNAIVGDALYGAKENDDFGLLSYEIEFLGEKVSI